jgi:hypothetical protein
VRKECGSTVTRAGKSGRHLGVVLRERVERREEK